MSDDEYKDTGEEWGRPSTTDTNPVFDFQATSVTVILVTILRSKLLPIVHSGAIEMQFTFRNVIIDLSRYYHHPVQLCPTMYAS